MAEFRRFFADPDYKQGKTICLRGGEFHHMKNVLRMRTGEQAVVCFDDGIDNLCTISEICEDKAVLSVEKSYKNAAESSVRITLFQALMKGDKMDFCVQKAVELGVAAIVPFESAFTVAKADAKKTPRFERIAFEAAKQCGRATLAKVEDPIDFKTMLQRLSEHEKVIFCNEREKENAILAALRSLPQVCDLAVIIGSEGGFSEQEAQEIMQEKNVVSVSFGKRVLRAETAGVFALSVLSAALAERE